MPYPESKIKSGRKLSPLLCGTITRALRSLSPLKGKVFVVGGIVTEGITLRDIDIVVTNEVDVEPIKKALGKYANRAHFMLQKKAPPSPIYIVITGEKPKSVDYEKPKKGEKIKKSEYAGSA